MKWSSDNKRKKRHSNVHFHLNIKIQHWILKHPSVIVSLIKNNVIFLRNEGICKLECV